MPDFSVSIDDSQWRAFLSRMPQQAERALRGGMEDATTLLLHDVTRYPPPPAGSRYQRTKTLGRSWSRRIEGGGLSIRGIVGSNSNMAPYNRWVQDRDRPQARVHRGRWEPVQEIAERRAAVISRMFADRLRAAIR